MGIMGNVINQQKLPVIVVGVFHLVPLDNIFNFPNIYRLKWPAIASEVFNFAFGEHA